MKFVTSAQGSDPTLGASSHLEDDLASFARHCVKGRCDVLLNTSYQSMSPLGRTYGCLYQGRVFTTGVAYCSRGLKHAGCGVCKSPPHRKDHFHYLMLAYNNLFRPRFDMCFAFNCQDSPVLFDRGRASGRLGGAYTGSPVSVEVPFPDYTIWQRYPEWLLQLQANPPLPWNRKLDRVVLVGGQLGASAVRRRVLGGSCDEALGRVGFIDVVGVADSDSSNSSGRSGGLRRIKRLPRLALCNYRVIVLIAGHSRWLDHMKYTMLCKSLVVLLMGQAVPRSHEQLPSQALDSAYSLLGRMMKSGATHLEVRVNESSLDMCSHVVDVLTAARRDEAKAHAMAKQGEALVRAAYSLRAIYHYLHVLFQRVAAIQAAGHANISAFIMEHGGVEITFENYDRVTKRENDARVLCWQRRPLMGNYTGWLGKQGAPLGLAVHQELVRSSPPSALQAAAAVFERITSLEGTHEPATSSTPCELMVHS